MSLCHATNKLPQELRRCLGERSTQAYDPIVLPLVDQCSVLLERLVSFRNGHLFGQHDAAEVVENRPQVHEPPKPTQRTGRCAHECDNLPAKGYQRRLVAVIGA